ncbi:MAG: hypothetical protein FDX12_03510 [Chlorobium sp.]|nr:MAG: hypothetical protein FDX12_03510 [Chlorobium sp.]
MRWFIQPPAPVTIEGQNWTGNAYLGEQNAGIGVTYRDIRHRNSCDIQRTTSAYRCTYRKNHTHQLIVNASDKSEHEQINAR